jgi:hypothetical protein
MLKRSAILCDLQVGCALFLLTLEKLNNYGLLISKQ